MPKNLMIVESPAKAKTLHKYLGRDFQVLASYGHVRDLVPKEGAVEPERDFAMRYELIEKNARHVEAIAKAAASAERLFLATDLDREGEAISWHIAEILRERGLLEGKQLHRVVFTEITPRAVREAIERPRALSQPLVDAQQARRALDYLVGFKLSPVLWRKVKTGLSAGRVQSPALRLIVEREEEIEAFVSREYWSATALLAHPAGSLRARLVRLDGRRLEPFDLADEASARAARERLLAAAGGALVVRSIQRRERQRRPAPPFTTSTLQQEAARKLGMGTSRTMRIAQALYEGVALGAEGTQGLITYMRTDSVHLAPEAVAEIRELIARAYGPDRLPPRPNRFQNRTKNAQEAHEAIRPTSIERTPESVAPFLTDEQLRLYELIWKRTVASQMRPALLSTVAVELDCGSEHGFRATGTTVLDPGFLAIYEEGRDQKGEEDEEASSLPPLAEGERVLLAGIELAQHFTEPPPRYSEASLVKALEEYGIGRPSTYATIIQTLLARKYVELVNRRFRPTDVGRAVAKFLTAHFGDYVDYDFTARLEDELDAVARGEESWKPLLRRFWEPLRDRVAEKLETVAKAEATGARELGIDPASGRRVSVRLGPYGPYVQLGSRDDPEKPRFAPLRRDQSMHTITLEEALRLFELPRVLGTDEQGQTVEVGIGRFGPYVRAGRSYASLEAGDDPHTLSLERALALLAAKRAAIANREIASFADGAIRIVRGRFGPFVTDGERAASLPKGTDPATLDEGACRTLLAERGRPLRRRGDGRPSAAAANPSPPPAKSASGRRRPARAAGTGERDAAPSPKARGRARRSAGS